MDQDPNIPPSASEQIPSSGQAGSAPPPPPHAQWQAPQPSYPASGISSDERMWAMLGHLSSLTGFISGLGFIIGPLIVWQIKKDVQPFASAQAREAFNFNLSLLLYTILLGILTVLLLFVGIGILLIPIFWAIPIIHLVLTIIAGLKANEGVPYRYPMTIRFF